MNILVLNCGSSTLKYQLVNMDNEQLISKGLAERIGIEGSRLCHTSYETGTAQETVVEQPMKDHTDAVALVLKYMKNVDAVGHRVVHGGEFFSNSILIDEKVKNALRECCSLAPLHNPPNLIGIEACEKLMPNLPQVAVFDTAFHQSLPDKAYMYALPYELYEKHKIRKYGFHGTSHRYVSAKAAEFLDKPYESLKIVTCHLGNGASVCAINGGKSVDTSMGFTPLEGLVMGTRTGDIDASVVGFLMEKEGMSAKEVDNLLNKKSGVLGLSGLSSDFRDLENAVQKGDKRAKLALDMFFYRAAKYVGSYAAAMNGIDVLVFTAGIGENSAATREAICSYLGYLGLTVDKEKNNCRGKLVDFATPDSKLRALVVPTNEELVIARDTKEILAK